MHRCAQLALTFVIACGFGCTTAAWSQTVVTVGTGFNYPLALATDHSGNVFVANTQSDDIEEIPLPGSFTPIETLGCQVMGAVGAVSDSQGDIFVVNDESSIAELPAAGGCIRIGSFSLPTALAIDSSGNLFVADLLPGAVYELSAASGYATQIKLGGYDSPTAIAVDQSGNLFITELGPQTGGTQGSIVEIEAAGGYQTTTTLVGSLYKPSGIAVDSAGNLYVSQFTDSGAAEIMEYSAAAKYATSQQLGSGFSMPQGLALDAAGNLIVADPGGGAVKELVASGGYTQVKVLGGGFQRPSSVSLDGSGNILVADSGDGAVAEILAAGGYATVETIVSAIGAPGAVATDGNGNVFVLDSYGTLKEFLAASGYARVRTLSTTFTDMSGLYPGEIAVDGSGNVFVANAAATSIVEVSAASDYATQTTVMKDPFHQGEVAVDASGDIFVANGSGNAIIEYLAEGGYTTTKTLAAGLGPFGTLTVDGNGNIFSIAEIADDPLMRVNITEIPAATGYTTAKAIATAFVGDSAIAVDNNGNVFVAEAGGGIVQEFVASPSPLFASVLPGSRSVQLGTAATVYATMLNTTSAALDQCQIALTGSAPAGLSLGYQATDPATNTPVGAPNTPVTIPGDNGSQTFVISFQGTAAFSTTAMPLLFTCSGVAPTNSIAGVNTIDLTMSTSATADFVALAATPTNNGILQIPITDSAAFAVASTDLGAQSPITVSVDTGYAPLPIELTVCQTNPSTAQCLQTPARSVSVSYASGTAPTFSVFAQSTGAIPLAPGISRVFVRFKDANGGIHGSTSVAVQGY